MSEKLAMDRRLRRMNTSVTLSAEELCLLSEAITLKLGALDAARQLVEDAQVPDVIHESAVLERLWKRLMTELGAMQARIR